MCKMSPERSPLAHRVARASWGILATAFLIFGLLAGAAALFLLFGCRPVEVDEPGGGWER